jgi:hypothetical protein
MRGFFGFLGFVAVLVALVAAFAVPSVVGPMVASSVRAASPFGDQPLDVQVDVDAIGLIRGFVREIHVSGSKLELDGATIESLDLRVRAVGIGDHAFAETLGGLDGIAIPTGDGSIISVARVTLSGPSMALIAEATMERAAAVAFIQHQCDVQGVAVSDLQLTAGGVSFVIFEQRVDVPIGVQDGALVIPDMLGAGPLELLAPLPDDPWRITGVAVTTNGIDIVASVDVGGLLRGS